MKKYMKRIKSEEELLNIALTFQFKNIPSKFILPQNLMEKYQNEFDWVYICMYQKLPQKFIKKFENKVVWWAISRYQKLSEKFMEKFENKLDWNEISEYQKLSNELIYKFKDKLNINYLMLNKNIDIDFVKQLYSYLLN